MNTIQSHKAFLQRTTEQEQFDCWKQIQSHISCEPPVHFGTRLKVLNAFFVEHKQQSDSVHLFTIIQRNKLKALDSVFLLNIFFPKKEITY